MMVRPRVVRILDEHVGEGALGLGEAAEIEERDRALVARVQVVGHGGERGVEAHQRFARAAEIVERLAFEQRQPRDAARDRAARHAARARRFRRREPRRANSRPVSV